MTASAGGLSCPACGAPVSGEPATCPYCGLALALVSCPKCLGRIFKGATHCSFCGASVAAAPSASPGDLKCPRCGVDFRMMTVGTADLGECGRCGGTWVDGTTFEHIVAEKEEQALVLQASLPGFQEKRAQARIDRYWPCPVCHKLMNRVNFAHVSGVVLDVCRVHGVWFDGDELRQLVEFIRSGGLDRARAAERRENAARPDPSPIVVLQTGDEPDPHHDLVIEGALKVLGWLLRR